MRWCLVILATLIVIVIAEDFELLILHNNDMHSRFEETSKLSGTCNRKKVDGCYGGFARVAHVLREARGKATSGEGPQVLYLNAGDTYTGTAWFSIFKWKIAAEFLDILKPDAMSLGNHEFDNGVDGLVPFLKQVQFPVVTCNLDLSSEPRLAETQKIQNSIVLTVAGRKIGIIGYLTPETKIISQTENVKFIPEVEAIKKESEKLKADGVQTIIALGHSGFEMDKIIARDVPLVDAVVGGHTNTFLYNGPPPDIEVPEGLYPVPIKQSSGKIVPVVQAYAYTKYMGRLTLILDSEGKVKSFKGQPQLLNSTIPQEKDVLQVLEKYRPQIVEMDRKVVGRTKTILDNTNCRTQECNIGNLIADAFVAYGSYFYGGSYWTDTPIAVQNSGGIRNTIDASAKFGNVTRGDLLGVLPFDNPMVKLSLNGSDLLEVLEVSVRSNGETSRGEFLQFSGLHVEYDLTKPPGSRVISAKARCGLCSVPTYEKVEPHKSYRLYVTQFMYNGGDGYSSLKEKAFNVFREDINDLEVVVWYMKRYNPVFPENEERIKIINAKQKEPNSGTDGTNSVIRFHPMSINVIGFTAAIVSLFNKI